MTNNFRLISVLTIIMVIPLIIVSYFGVFISSTYSRETASLAAQGVGQDIVNLFIVVPMLLISLFFIRKNYKIAYLVFSGAVSYILYSFVIYSLGIHFNNLFLLYCAILGLSIYIFIITLIDMSKIDFINIKENNVPYRSISSFLIIVSAMFSLIWLKEIVPAIINNTVPKSVADFNILVNPVHVIDLSFALPGLIVSAVLLLKRKHLGYVLTPISLLFILIMAVALIGMVIMMKINGITDDISIAVIFAILALISIFLLLKLFKSYS